MINRFIGKKIRIAREQLSFSQSKLGKLTNYSVPTLSLIESGKINVSIESLCRIAKALKKPMSFFTQTSQDEDYTVSTNLIGIENELEQIKQTLNKAVLKARKSNFNIAVSGGMGTGDNGRFHLIRVLARIFKAKAFPENPASNPFLDKFYKNKKKWGFHSQLFFFKENFKQQAEIRKKIGPVIQGRSIYENFRVFATVWYEMGYLSRVDFHLLEDLYSQAIQIIRKPDLIVYFKSNPERIAGSIARYRSNKINLSHIKSIHSKYETWRKTFDLAPVLTFDFHKIDLFDDKTIKMIADKIQDEL
ncbi:MAG: deoxynucleoside kinase [Candidatus Dojkabacteria bacterium]|jgi:deoxyadenosine/deoxycytidine kinase/DNA-binding XRE family transcriptional regulator|nr:deoxynucleoside kinase [Candidatus Dojkabacteria bacterium]